MIGFFDYYYAFLYNVFINDLDNDLCQSLLQLQA